MFYVNLRYFKLFKIILCFLCFFLCFLCFFMFCWNCSVFFRAFTSFCENGLKTINQQTARQDNCLQLMFKNQIDVLKILLKILYDFYGSVAFINYQLSHKPSWRHVIVPLRNSPIRADNYHWKLSLTITIFCSGRCQCRQLDLYENYGMDFFCCWQTSMYSYPRQTRNKYHCTLRPYIPWLRISLNYSMHFAI